jgi:hypothetical protein
MVDQLFQEESFVWVPPFALEQRSSQERQWREVAVLQVHQLVE